MSIVEKAYQLIKSIVSGFVMIVFFVALSIFTVLVALLAIVINILVCPYTIGRGIYTHFSSKHQLFRALKAGDLKKTETLLASMQPNQVIAALTHMRSDVDLITDASAIWGILLGYNNVLKMFKATHKISTFSMLLSPSPTILLVENPSIIDVLQQILAKLNRQQKIDLLKQPVQLGRDALLSLPLLVINNSNILNYVLGDLDQEAREELFTQSINEKMLFEWFEVIEAQLEAQTHDQQNPDHSIHAEREAMRQCREIFMFYGAPQAIRKIQIKTPNINPPESTHTASVHASLDRSAIALVSLYVPSLSEAVKQRLMTWKNESSALKAQNNEEFLKQQTEIKELMQSTEVKDAIDRLTQAMQPELEALANQLDSSLQRNLGAGIANFIRWILRNNNVSNQVAARAIRRLLQQNTVVEGSTTGLTLKQALVLVYCAVQDGSDPLYSVENKKETFISELCQLQRHKNTSKTDFEDQPACLGGQFNSLIDLLVGQHSAIERNMISPEILMQAAQELLPEVFDASNYDSATLQAYKNYLEASSYVDACEMVTGVQQSVQDLLNTALCEKYGQKLAEAQIIPSKIEEIVYGVSHETPDKAVALILKKINDCLVQPQRPIISSFNAQCADDRSVEPQVLERVENSVRCTL